MTGTPDRPAARTRRSVLRTTATAGGGLLTGCVGGERTASPTTTTTDGLHGSFSVAGSSTVYPITLEVADRFSERHDGVSVSVSSTGTGGGFENFFCLGRTVMNDASRPIEASESESCSEHGIVPVEFQVAIDAVTVVVNPRADWVECVTTDELAAIWRPDGANRWSEIRDDWPDEPFSLFGPTQASGTYDYFAEAVMGTDTAHRTDHVGTEQDSTIVTNVAESPYGMGYFGLAYYRRNANVVRALSIDGGEGCIAPGPETATDGGYVPLSRPLFLYVDRHALEDPLVREFCRFYLSACVDVAETVDYVPISELTARRNRRRFERIIEDLT